jgi:disulfide bond formation protein DsbB
MPVTLFCVALVSFASVGLAVWMQQVEGLYPCPLCIIQRYAFLAIGTVSLLAVLVPGQLIRSSAALFNLFAAIGGIVAAGRQLWVIAHPHDSCGADFLEDMVNGLPPAHWAPKVFMALGNCSDNPIGPLGINFPTWAVIGYGGIMLIILLAWWLDRRATR